MPTKTISIFKAFHTAPAELKGKQLSGSSPTQTLAAAHGLTSSLALPLPQAATGTQSQHTAPALPAAPTKTELRARPEASPTKSSHSGMAKIHKEPLSTNSAVPSPANPLGALALMEVPLEMFRKMVFGQKNFFLKSTTLKLNLKSSAGLTLLP